ncbi:MAG: hypothetical protein DELT_02263 [Desulfovibrio sp.]
MSLPTKLRQAAALFRNARLAALSVLAACCLTACGYGFGADAETVLVPVTPGVTPTLKIKSVDNPTLYPWLAHVIRSEVRDEIAARKLAVWVDSGKADYELTIKVDSFLFRSWLTDKDDVTTLYSGSLTFEGILYKASTNEEIWRSGNIGYSQNYEQVQERTAASELTRELARRLASRMQQAF